MKEELTQTTHEPTHKAVELSVLLNPKDPTIFGKPIDSTLDKIK